MITPSQASQISVLNPPNLSVAIKLIEHGGVFAMSQKNQHYDTVKALLDGGMIEKVDSDQPAHRAQQYRVLSP